jgi:hypothetical protein
MRNLICSPLDGFLTRLSDFRKNFNCKKDTHLARYKGFP